MRNLEAPVAAKNQHYDFTIGLQDAAGEDVESIKVEFTGFNTLGGLVMCLEQLRISNALIQAQAQVMASSPEEFGELLERRAEEVARENIARALGVTAQYPGDLLPAEVDEYGLPVTVPVEIEGAPDDDELDPYAGHAVVRGEVIDAE
jgi:hypothetical protein